MAQRQPVPRINVGPQALRYAQRRLRLPSYATPLKVSSFSDTFDTLDLVTKWLNWGQASILNGQLIFPVTSGYDGGLTALVPYDITECSLSVQLVQAPNVGNGSTTASFQLSNGPAGGWFHDIVFAGGNIVARTITPYGGTTNLWTATYDGVAHKFWRFRESGGTIYYETSPDASTWVTQCSTPAVFSLSSAYIKLYAGYWAAETDPGTVIFDNLNLLPSNPVSNPIRPVSRMTGPMSLRQMLKQRARPSQPPTSTPWRKAATFTDPFDALDPTKWVQL